MDFRAFCVGSTPEFLDKNEHSGIEYMKPDTADWDQILHKSSIRFKQDTNVPADKQTNILKLVTHKWHTVIKKNRKKSETLLVDHYIKTLKNCYKEHPDLKSKLELYEFKFPIWVVSAWLRDFDDPSNHAFKGRKFKYPDICYNFLDTDNFTQEVEYIDGKWSEPDYPLSKEVSFSNFINRHTDFFAHILRVKKRNVATEPKNIQLPQCLFLLMSNANKLLYP